MDATSMQSKTLLEHLQQDFSHITFLKDKTFRWSFHKQTVFYNLSLPYAAQMLLHETAHGILRHKDYNLDVQLIKKELAAWEYAQETLAPQYGITLTTEYIEESLDSYRQWLHARSTCPECHIAAFQTKTGTYACVACGCQWRANDARKLRLRRLRTAI